MRRLALLALGLLAGCCSRGVIGFATPPDPVRIRPVRVEAEAEAPERLRLRVHYADGEARDATWHLAEGRLEPREDGGPPPLPAVVVQLEGGFLLLEREGKTWSIELAREEPGEPRGVTALRLAGAGLLFPLAAALDVVSFPAQLIVVLAVML